MNHCKHFPKVLSLPLQELSNTPIKSCKLCKTKRPVLNLDTQTLTCECQSLNTSILFLILTNQFKCNQCQLLYSLEKSKFSSLLPRPSRFLGVSGLSNLGNTCFINVILQTFSNLVIVNKLLTKFAYPVIEDLQEIQSLRLAKELCKVIHSLWQGSVNVEPKEFINECDMNYRTLSRKKHQDTQEFFKFLYETLEASLDKTLKTQFLKDCFLWRIKTNIMCQNCKGRKVASEEFVELFLSIPRKKELNAVRLQSQECFTSRDRLEINQVSKGFLKKIKLLINSHTTEVVSLYDCLTEYFKDEHMNDPKNLIFCETCNSNQSFVKTPKIDTMPNVLTIQFKRYLSSSKKYPIHVQLPIDLDLSRFSENSSKLYQLTCVVAHRGDMDGGHYVAYCKNRKNGHWYKFDDRRVTEKTVEEVLGQQVYLAFYSEVHRKRKLGGGSDVFVPREWAVKYRYLNDPGMFDVAKYLCKHQKVSIEFPVSNFIQANSEEVKDFSIGNKRLFNIQKCEICTENLERTRELAVEEEKIIESLFMGNNEYVVSGLWWSSWEDFVKKGKNSPGPIENFGISEKIGKAYTLVHRICRKAWIALVFLYSADVQIIQEGQEFKFIELSSEFVEEILRELEDPLMDKLKTLKENKLKYA